MCIHACMYVQVYTHTVGCQVVPACETPHKEAIQGALNPRKRRFFTVASGCAGLGMPGTVSFGEIQQLNAFVL